VRPRNVVQKPPRAFAVTVFVRVPFAETTTVTRSFLRKFVPWTETGEVDGTVTRAVRLEEATAATGNIAATSTSRATSLTTEQYPPRTSPILVRACVRLRQLAVVESLVEDRLLDAVLPRDLP
jgi:hypothetical protein